MKLSTPEQRKFRIMYCNIMGEIKARHQIILNLYAGVFNVPPLASYELCYLQFRMICELIALGCLAVHGDSGKTLTKRLHDAHEADFILKKLEQLHPRFYPEPGYQLDRPSGGHVFIPANNPMKKADLIKLYWRCGEILHRGRFKNIKQERVSNFDDVIPLCRRIADLLKFHRIAFLNSEDQLWLTMHEEGKPVTASLRRAIRLP